MKLKYEMSVIDIDGEKIAVPIGDSAGFRGVLQVNDTAEQILRLLEQDTDEEKIVAALAEEYDDTEKIRLNVSRITEKLRTEGLLSE